MAAHLSEDLPVVLNSWFQDALVQEFILCIFFINPFAAPPSQLRL